MVAEVGFEPTLHGPQPNVLPLHHTTTNSCLAESHFSSLPAKTINAVSLSIELMAGLVESHLSILSSLVTGSSLDFMSGPMATHVNVPAGL